MRYGLRLLLAVVALANAGTAFAGPRHRIFPLFSRSCPAPRCCPTPAPVYAAVESVETNPWQHFFPLKPGTKWVYRIADQEMTIVVVGREEFNGEECAKVETTLAGRVNTSLLAVRKDGVYTVKADSDTVDPPTRILAYPLTTGTSWVLKPKIGARAAQGEYSVADERAMVFVPAGVFEAVLIEGNDVAAGMIVATVRMWFAPGVGMVKATYKIGNSEMVMALTRFEEGK